MQKTIILFVLFLWVIMFQGCFYIDGDTSRNSEKNSEGKTKLGYFGKDVYIGDHQGKRQWKIVSGKNKKQLLHIDILHTNNFATVEKAGKESTITYGVSSNAMSIMIAKDSLPFMRVEILKRITSNTYKANLLFISEYHSMPVTLETGL